MKSESNFKKTRKYNLVTLVLFELVIIGMLTASIILKMPMAPMIISLLSFVILVVAALFFTVYNEDYEKYKKTEAEYLKNCITSSTYELEVLKKRLSELEK